MTQLISNCSCLQTTQPWLEHLLKKINREHKQLHEEKVGRSPIKTTLLLANHVHKTSYARNNDPTLPAAQK